MINKYYNRAFHGNSSLVMYVLSNLIVWASFMILGSIPLTVAIYASMASDPGVMTDFISDPSDMSIFGLQPNILFILILAQFVIGFISVHLTTKYILKRPFLTIMSGFSSFRWKRFFTGAGLWTVLMIAFGFVLYAIKPEIFTATVNWEKFLIFLPLALLLVPIQCAFEELAFRGLFMQTMFKAFPKVPVLGILLQGVLFGLIHSFNPEVDKYGFFLMMTHYIGFGLFLGVFAWVDEGLELPIGIHAANNLFSFLFLTYEGVAIETPALITQTETNPAKEFIGVMVMALVVFGLLLWKKRSQLSHIINKKLPENLQNDQPL